MKIYTFLFIVSMVCVFHNNDTLPKVRAINTQRDFEQNILKVPMVVAYFYADKNKNLKRMYEDVSNYQPYNDADILFLKINLARKELAHLASLYGIKTMPAFIFFYRGKRLSDERGNLVQVTGIIPGMDLRGIIDRYYGADIKKYIVAKEARNERRLLEENEAWKEYFYPRTVNVPSYSPEERDME